MSPSRLIDTIINVIPCIPLPNVSLTRTFSSGMIPNLGRRRKWFHFLFSVLKRKFEKKYERISQLSGSNDSYHIGNTINNGHNSNAL